MLRREAHDLLDVVEIVQEPEEVREPAPGLTQKTDLASASLRLKYACGMPRGIRTRSPGPAVVHSPSR